MPVDPTPAAALGRLRRDAIRGTMLMAAVSLVCNVGALAVPLYNMEVFNRVMSTHNLGTLVSLSVALAITAGTYIVLDHLRGRLMAALGERFARRLMTPLLQAVQATWPNGTEPMQALRDAETLRSFIGSPLLNAPFDLFWSPVLLVVLLLMGWAYAVAGMVCIIVLTVVNLLGEESARRHLVESNQATAASLRDVATAARSAEAVLAMGMLPALSRRWAGAEAQAAASGTQAMLRSKAFAAATKALRSGMTGAVVATGLVLVLSGGASPGSLIASNMILARILLPFENFASTLKQWTDAAAAWRRVHTLLNSATPFRYPHALPRPEGHLVIEGLAYLPPGAERPILRGISFKAAPGEIIGVIGPSASGKSTLLRLALGMTEPTSGGVFLDGHSTYLWCREDFARHVGYVPQSLVLGDGTVAQTIARGAVEPDLGLVVAAAKRAGLHEIVADLPYGYATVIAGGGFTLSSGQRQRLAIARALYGSPRLVVLDEPNAFLDGPGEQMLTTLLYQLRNEGVGALVSAHRPSVLQAAHKLLVLRDGLAEHFGDTADVLRQMNGPKIRLIRAAAS